MRVTLYSRPECPLCDDVERDLADLQHTLHFDLDVRNILDADDSFARYRYLIPVVDVEGGPVLTPPHDPYSLESSIRRALAAREGESSAHGPVSR